jgi:hypothetical protein
MRPARIRTYSRPVGSPRVVDVAVARLTRSTCAGRTVQCHTGQHHDFWPGKTCGVAGRRSGGVVSGPAGGRNASSSSVGAELGAGVGEMMSGLWHRAGPFSPLAITRRDRRHRRRRRLSVPPLVDPAGFITMLPDPGATETGR